MDRIGKLTVRLRPKLGRSVPWFAMPIAAVGQNAYSEHGCGSWLRVRMAKKGHTEEAARPETAVFRFDKVDPVQPSPKFGNTGPQGWGFTLWGSPDGEEFMYRHLLETFAKQNPDARLELPEWSDCEDLIEGELIWHSRHVWVWYETVLSHIWLWSAERDVIDSLRSAMLPMAKPS